MTIQKKAIEKYFRVLLFITLYKVALFSIPVRGLNCFRFSRLKKLVILNTTSALKYIHYPFLADSLCDPPCLEGETCNEIAGKCVCDPTRRDEEMCRRRQGKSSLMYQTKKRINNLNLATVHFENSQFLISLNIWTPPFKY